MKITLGFLDHSFKRLHGPPRAGMSNFSKHWSAILLSGHSRLVQRKSSFRKILSEETLGPSYASEKLSRGSVKVNAPSARGGFNEGWLLSMLSSKSFT
jgi:hypothetical protein